jgi:hypothetical protein
MIVWTHPNSRRSMEESSPTEKNIGIFATIYRPFKIPQGVYDESRLISMEEY